MSATPSSVLERAQAAGGHPAITYRQAGDRSLLIEYGEMELDLTLNFFVLAVDAALSERPVDGLLESAPGFRSMLVRYDPRVVSPAELVEHLARLHDSLPAEQEIEIPSRVIELPIAFDDSQSRAAVERYIRSIRKDAPNCEGANNIDYIVRYNGFNDREEFYAAVLATEHWTGFIGFFPGLPFMFPVDPRHTVVAPKYNPTRTWTAEGAVGLGGPCYAIYPVESAGGYQLFGRSLPVYDLQARNEVFRENPLLLRPGDRVRFRRTTEEELLSAFEDVRADRYRYRIEEHAFDVGAYLELREQVREEADERRRRREEASAEAEIP
ncbi:MAG: carboxyltransferase domain-containing protein [Solirubrobacterales bacterium]|nr:carboxyltransferase domain-containing protein [Solirubrobacterales bacterium]MBV9716452.1 carboxyltransferase domain-containing protein [Solirubrobacterales bacterium]